MDTFEIGSQVHIDTDNEEWECRICEDGTVTRFGKIIFSSIYQTLKAELQSSHQKRIAMSSKREKELAELRKKFAEELKKIKYTYICKGDPTIDCLRWYICDQGEHITNPHKRYRLEGKLFGQVNMSMHISCAENPNDYMPDKLRAKALELINPQINEVAV